MKLIANEYIYSTGAIETVQLVHYRNLTDDGAWVFNETADIVFVVPLHMSLVDSSEDEPFEFTVVGELPQACGLAGERAKLSQ